MTHAIATTPNEKAALDDIAITYLGASLSGHRYGLYTNETFPRVLTIANTTAFFSGVWPSTDPHHESTMLFTPYANILLVKVR